MGSSLSNPTAVQPNIPPDMEQNTHSLQKIVSHLKHILGQFNPAHIYSHSPQNPI